VRWPLAGQPRARHGADLQAAAASNLVMLFRSLLYFTSYQRR
jgi:hypothetical protein